MDEIKSIILKHSDDSSVFLPNGCRFIRKIPGGKLLYLHKMFPPRNLSDVPTISGILGFRPSGDYMEFMEYTDGISSFGNILSIYGLSENAARSLELEDQRAISLYSEVIISRRSRGSDWTPIGSISSATLTFKIETNDKWHIRLGKGDMSFRIFPDFYSFIRFIFPIIDNIADQDGLKDRTGRALESEITSSLNQI